MIVILCIDDRGGLLFNKRRVSSDQKVCERICALAADGVLRMNHYSALLFKSIKPEVDEDFMNQAEAGDFCFVEDQDLSQYGDKIEKWILYRWNRNYPSDFKFDFSLLNGKELIQSSSFEGSSHSEITEEIYQ